MIVNFRTAITRSTLFLSLVKTAAVFKVSYILGPWTLFFSATNIITPLTGAFGGMPVAALVVVVGTLLSWLMGVATAPYFITYHIPGLFASAYWAHNHWGARALVPLICMVLFIAHPQGMYAAPYTLYWLIPVGIYVFNKQTIFAQSLAATFVAHAVGSVIWLYTVPMTTAQWYMLIPVVAVERLLFATGMTVAYFALKSLFSFKVFQTSTTTASHISL